MDNVEKPSESRAPLIRLVLGLVELWMTAMVLILATAFVMGLLGANTDGSFASWINNRTQEIMSPFNGILDPIELTGDTVVNASLLFAMAVYGVLAAVFDMISRRIRTL